MSVLTTIAIIILIAIYYYFRENIPNWFKEGFESVTWNILGNLLPLYVMVFISISDKGFEFNSIYEALHQPFTLLILSGTYLTNSYYIISKNRIENKIFPVIYGIALLFVGLLIKDKTSLENLSANYYKELTVVILFLISFFLYLFIEFRSYYLINNLQIGNDGENEYNNLENDFDGL